MSYTKLFASLLTSTIWLENDQTRIVWITMLALADKNGEVQASIPGLARLAGVSLEATEAALAKFLAPDPYSRTNHDEGRRIQPIEGGWWLINHSAYREKASHDDRAEKNRERQRRFKASHPRQSVTEALPSVTEALPRGRGNKKVTDICQAEAEAEAEAETEEIHSTSTPTIVEPKPSTRTPPSSPEAERIFEHWKSALNHPQAIFTSKRRKLVADRLKEGYTVAQLIEAINGCAMSPFHQGENKDGTVFDDLELICRSGEKVEQFIGFIASSQGRPNGEILRRTAPRRESETERRIRQTVESINTPPEGVDADRAAIAAMPRIAGS